MAFPDTDGFAPSFSHAVILVNDRQFTAIDNVSINQDLQEAPVYGTSRGPIGRSAGQIQMGQGSLNFSDYREGTDFFTHLSPDPFFKIWTLDYSLVLESGTTRSVECRACRLTGTGIEHATGPDAVGIKFPFSFLSLRINRIDVALSPRALLQAGLGIAQRLVNIL